MPSYRLTRKAEEDLFAIAVYGIEQFGVLQARLYRDKFLAHFAALAETPALYQRVDFVREGYRRSVCGVHSIYYRQDGEIVEIVRVLGQQDTRVLQK